MTLLTILLLWRGIDAVTIFLSNRFVPTYTPFLYPDVSLFSFMNRLANFDGTHYISIARHGYGLSEQAFFPLYPFLIKLLYPLFQNHLLVGVTISHLSFFAGAIIFYRYVKLMNVKHTDALWTVIFLLVFPTSFFFTSVYTEGFFFFLAVLSLYLMKRKRYIAAFLPLFFASLTRLAGVFLCIPVFVHFLIERKRQKRMSYITLLPLLTSVAGLSVYMMYLWKTYGDPLLFFHSQPAFGANRSTNLIFIPQVIYRYLRILITAAHNLQYYIALLELSIFILCTSVILIDSYILLKEKKTAKTVEFLGVHLFSLVNLVLPTLTGTLSSIPRYALMSFSFFMVISRIRSPFRFVLAGVFVTFHIVLLIFFSQGYFVS